MKRTELTDSSGAFDALLDAAVDAIIIIDQRGAVQRFNQAAQKMFGYSEPEMLGVNVRLLMPEPYRGQHDSYLERYRETGTATIIGTGREVDGQRKDGSMFPMFLSR